MFMCEDRHESIVCEGYQCPLCELMEALRDEDAEGDQGQDEMRSLVKEVVALRDRVAELEQALASNLFEFERYGVQK